LQASVKGGSESVHSQQEQLYVRLFQVEGPHTNKVAQFKINSLHILN